MAYEEFDVLSEALAEEFGLTVKKKPGNAQFFRVETEAVTNPHLRAPESVPVYHVLGIDQHGDVINIVAEKNSQYKEKIMNLEDFSKRLDAFLRKRGFEQNEYPVRGQHDLAVSLSYSFWRKEIEVKEAAPKLRVR